MNNSKVIGENVRSRRAQLGITQDTLRQRMGYSALASISKIENGKFKPNSYIMEMLAVALETSPSALGYVDENLEPNNALGRNIKEKRKELGITQEELRKALGYTSSGSLSQIEHGRFIPPDEIIQKLAQVLQTTPEELREDKSIKKSLELGQKVNNSSGDNYNSKITPLYITGKSIEEFITVDKPSDIFGSEITSVICVVGEDMKNSGICPGDFCFLSDSSPNNRSKNYIGGIIYEGRVLIRRICHLEDLILLVDDIDEPISISNSDPTLEFLGPIISVLKSI